MTINILGTPYKLTVKKYEEDEAFDRLSIAGYCDSFTKELVVCDMATYKGWEHEKKETCEICQKQSVRHEITHAFFHESGLMDSSFEVASPWSQNEEMIDWIALQAPKFYKAWKEADAL